MKKPFRRALKKAVILVRKRVRGITAPTEKTVKAFRPYIEKRLTAQSKGVPEKAEQSAKESRDITEFVRRLSRSFSEISRAQNKEKQKLVSRINARYALNALGIRDIEKRRAVLALVDTWMEQINYHRETGMFNSQHWVETAGQRLLAILGPNKSIIFSALLLQKDKKWEKMEEKLQKENNFI
ncbi:MAG: hypothetical protein Q7S92_06725 [Candidatus Diapherotrites archaeon]|nr:hypothetical protein [Candidatus Diapherotrites archaeon]